MSLDGKVCPNPIYEWDDKQKKRYYYNVKAMNAFFYSLNHIGKIEDLKVEDNGTKNISLVLKSITNYEEINIYNCEE
ncbi:hypothetical protein NC652_010757 [Populus alba x Populus x berolinensis]|nr:hypothetical protein NC652_010757 [Populus alba x Populus x berolinensis]